MGCSCSLYYEDEEIFSVDKKDVNGNCAYDIVGIFLSLDYVLVEEEPGADLEISSKEILKLKDNPIINKLIDFDELERKLCKENAILDFHYLL